MLWTYLFICVLGLVKHSALNAHVVPIFVHSIFKHIDHRWFNSVLWQMIPFIDGSLTEGNFPEADAYSGFEQLISLNGHINCHWKLKWRIEPCQLPLSQLESWMSLGYLKSFFFVVEAVSISWAFLHRLNVWKQKSY